MKPLLRKIFFSLLILTYAISTYATHQRAAEITYRLISGLTYEFTLITYTYTPSPADRPELEIFWGDGTSTQVRRNLKIDLPNDISKNTYIAQHTFPAPGNYIISMLDPNRNAGVINIPNSVNTPMYVETELVINPFLGNNNSPVLLNPPIDRGCVGRPFIHNPGAYDADGDSLSYKLIACKGYDGLDIPGYTFPAGNIFRIDEFTGELLWDAPLMEGEYNIAILIEEWRRGFKIGSVIRDMQVLILACDNQPPTITTINDTCVEAGDTLLFKVYANDVNAQDRITLTATGGPLQQTVNPAVFTQPVNGYSPIHSTFFWITACSHVRKQPYQMFFKAIDNGTPVNLVTYKTLNIKVVGPSPKNLTATPLGNSIILKWEQSKCSNAVYYDIYRHNGYIGFVPNYCETGVPSYTGYVKIGSTSDISDTTFTDNDNGNGLIHGIQYCYMVVAVYPDGAESYASLEACAYLKKDLPVITHVSILKTNEVTGRAYIEWSMPTELDLSITPGPFRYKIYRGEGYNLYNPVLIDSLENLTDTTYVDSLFDTQNNAISYRIDFYNTAPANYFKIGSSQKASSVFLTIQPTDEAVVLQWNELVPWINDTFIVYKQNKTTLTFDSIGYTTQHTYKDTGLINDSIYCYKVKSRGFYNAPGFVYPIYNFSQESCGKPYDNVPPCVPQLTVNTDCEFNYISWENVYRTCARDIMKYELYFKSYNSYDFTLLYTSSNPFDTMYVHQLGTNVVGCYSIVAFDSLNNRSPYSEMICVTADSCPDYNLPNVFTPNNDLVNDLYTPYPYANVDKVNMQIFNRWGTLVFKTENPDINWDGKDYVSKRDCAEGVYYFVCEVFLIRTDGIKKKTINGTIQLLR